MDITLRDFLDLYDFKQWFDDDKKELGTKKVRIYYNQPMVNTDENKWFEFGMFGVDYDIAKETINGDILNQLVKSISVVEYDVCNPMLRIDTFVHNDTIDVREAEILENQDQEAKSKTDILSENRNEPKSKVLTEKQIMFLKSLDDKWKYICCCDGNICISTKEPTKTLDGSNLAFDDECDFEYINNLTDKFLFCKNEIYLIEHLIRGVCDAFLALGYMGNYVKRFPQKNDFQNENLKF